MFSQFGKLEVQGQGANRVCFRRGLSPWLADTMYSRGLFSEHLHSWCLFFFLSGHLPYWMRAPPSDLINIGAQGFSL